MDESFKNVLRDHQIKQQKLTESIAGLPFEITTFSPEAINRIIQIKKDLHRITANVPIDQGLSAAIGYMDSHSWQARFTTGEPGIRNADQDSLYWVTKEGASIRFKMSNKSDGVARKVMQPFFEKIFFNDNDGNVYFEPQVGRVAHEFMSEHFRELQDKDSFVAEPFNSKIRTYKKDGVAVHVESPKGGYFHTSSHINFLR